MNCPKCNVTLIMSDRQGIEIDYCPTCRGVWLDRGELDKIVQRSQAYERRDYDDDDDDDDRRRSTASYPPQQGNYPPPPQGGHYQGHYPKKRKSWWSELFD